MTDKPAPDKPAAPAGNPLEEAQKRVGELQTAVTTLRQETAILEGRSATRDPKKVAEVQKENALLQARQDELTIVLSTLLSRLAEALADPEAQSLFEQLKSSALAHFAAAKIDEARWKDVVSL